MTGAGALVLEVGENLTEPPETGNIETAEEDENAKKIGAKKKSKKTKVPDVEMEPAPFPVDKLINQRAFGHSCDIRHENPGNLGKIVMFFHQQVEDYLQGDQQFIIRTLWKTKSQ